MCQHLIKSAEELISASFLYAVGVEYKGILYFLEFGLRGIYIHDFLPLLFKSLHKFYLQYIPKTNLSLENKIHPNRTIFTGFIDLFQWRLPKPLKSRQQNCILRK